VTEISEAFHQRLRQPAVELPVDPQQWIDDSLGWLIEHFGTEPLHRAAVVPADFVAAGYDGSEAAALDVCLRVCERMEIPSDRIRFSFRLDTVEEVARAFALVMLESFAAGTLPDVPPEEIAAVRRYSRFLGTPSLEQVARLQDDDRLVADLGSDLRPEVRNLAFVQFVAEVERCREIAAEPDLQRRAVLEQAPNVWLDPPEDGRWVGRRMELVRYAPGLRMLEVSNVEPLPGYSAIMLDPDVLADPTGLLAAVTHELGHEGLSRSGLPEAGGPLREPLTDLYAVFQGFGIAQVNAALDETTFDDPEVWRSGYLGEHTMTDALAAYRFRQHALVQDGPLIPAWHEALDPVPRARFLERLGKLDAPLT
jgi:hypothetical protein